jgi:hypothetical protein
MAEEIKVGFVVFECPKCGRKHSSRADFAGLKAKCLGCGSTFMVPAQGQKAQLAADKPSAGEATQKLPPAAAGVRSAKATRSGQGTQEAPAGDRSATGTAPGEGTEKLVPLEDKPKPRADGISRVQVGKDGLARVVLDDADDKPAFPDLEPEWEQPRKRSDPAGTASDKKEALKKIAVVSSMVLTLVGAGYAIYLFFKPAGNMEAYLKAAQQATNAQDDDDLYDAAGNPKYTDEAGNATDKFGRPLPPKGAATKPAAATTTAAATTVTQPAPATPQGSRPAPKGIIKLTAAQLARADALNILATNQKRKGALLEIRGNFLANLTINPLRLPPRGETLLKAPGPRLHALFAEGDSPQVYCDLEKSPTPIEVWKKLQAGQVITVRGTFNADRTLFDCELIRTSAAADDLYANREVGIVGTLESFVPLGDEGFPVIQLERDTRTVLEVKFLFRRPDAESLRSLRIGQVVTVAGTSKGIRSKVIRFENCRIVPPSGGGSGPVVVPIDLLIREYEKDFTSDELPPPESELGPPITLRAPQLAKEYETDPAQASRRTLNKAVILNANVFQVFPSLKKISLEVDTDQKLQVQCLFRPSKYRELETLKGQDPIVVRGVCSGLQDRRILRIDECERVDKPAEDARKITAEYYPFKVGQKQVYDSRDANKNVRRRIFYYREGQIIEYATVRQGVLRGASLLEDGTIKWVKNLNVYSANLFHYRINRIYLEIGTPQKDARGRETIFWEQVLKLGGRVGDSWSITVGNGERTYSVDGFSEDHGRPAVVVMEKFKPQGRGNQRETKHVYVKDVGEVARTTFEVVPGRSSKTLIEEVKLVEGEEAEHPRGPAAKVTQ